ncbi:hypothetical protein EYF80_022454 [Liparis tanakae]|uniref:Uncharacterized protein n=1 Tax=Liparis tanakae TaxID=230148 RepID=A0A4Z2HNJ5_9TELE|nr:hypothetical protein EYF80_022454 [Liparis tanakae]
MMDTELPEAPITPTTLSGLGRMGGSPLEQRTSEVSFWMRAWTKVSDCSRAYVSLEQVSRIRAPSVMLGSRSGSLLIWSKAYSKASNRWTPFSLLISPQGTPAGPRECTGNSPPKPGAAPTSSAHVSRSHVWYLKGGASERRRRDERACDVMMRTSRVTSLVPIHHLSSSERGLLHPTVRCGIKDLEARLYLSSPNELNQMQNPHPSSSPSSSPPPTV